ncbi:MAG: hypothetical protein KDA52_07700 [Planctomycetaceae bacterium]|nr:hypothetical protein [Planctomycetaceae bacterium]
MPMFLCPCCGEAYIVPLAFSEFILEEHFSKGWNGSIAPARCLSCQGQIHSGDAVVVRNGEGVTPEGDRQEIPANSKATVVEVSTWEGEGSIFRVRLNSGEEFYLTRAQLSLESSSRAR